ncbi:uncharacterized protein LOC116252810 [Nymphaea colorata]|nr:uncharacterized protein LOC116252810 [Nymphaea colorata]XP_031483220.1 uncharacterized protein LOC116252810 [Nymphaea colorata]XP_031483222.1 uncharacterized protein LOC116252810 [Nymphaea colorata]
MGRGGGRRPSAPSGMPPQLVGCAVCKIDCNSLEILEQHRQGKRHQRNVQRLEEERKRRRPNNVSDTKPANEAENIVDSQNNEVPESENLPTSPVSENRSGAEQHPENAELQPENVEKQAENAEEQQQQQRHVRPGFMGRGGIRRPRPGGYEDRRLGPKKRQKGKPQFDPRKGKRVKMASVPPPSADQQLPKICALCNITCDSQAVLDCHLAGKRHAAKVKRFQSQQQLYGPQVLQALFISQAQQAISLAQQQAAFNPQDQQAVLEALLGQAIQQVLAGQQAVAGTQDHSGPSGSAATVGATSELQGQEPAAGTEEQAASESENEAEGDKQREHDTQEEQGVDVQAQEGDVQQEGSDGQDQAIDVEEEQVDGQDQGGDVQEEQVDGQDQGGDAQADVIPLEEEYALPPPEDSIPAPEFGASASECTVPGLEIKPEETPVNEAAASEE